MILQRRKIIPILDRYLYYFQKHLVQSEPQNIPKYTLFRIVEHYEWFAIYYIYVNIYDYTIYYSIINLSLLYLLGDS